MSETIGSSSPVVPLEYDASPARGDSAVGIVAFAMSVLCLSLPAFMAYEALFRHRTKWAVYSPYAAGGQSMGWLSRNANTIWFAADTVAIVLGLVGIYLGRARFGAAATGIAVLAMAAVMTFVLGSP